MRVDSIIARIILVTTSAPSHNQINELLRAVSIQSDYQRCIFRVIRGIYSLYWLSSSAFVPSNFMTIDRVLYYYV